MHPWGPKSTSWHKNFCYCQSSSVFSKPYLGNQKTNIGFNNEATTDRWVQVALASSAEDHVKQLEAVSR